MNLSLSLKILRKQKIKTLSMILAVAIATSLPLNVSIILGSSEIAVYEQLTNRGTDDVSIMFREYKSIVDVRNTITELHSKESLLIEPRINLYGRVIKISTERYRSCRFIGVQPNDSWLNGLILDAGNIPSDSSGIVIGKELAEILSLSVGESIQLSLMEISEICELEISGIAHEVGQPLSLFCTGFSSILNSSVLENNTNNIGIKIHSSSGTDLSLTQEIATDLSNIWGSATVLTPKISYAEPVLNTLEDAKMWIIVVFSFSLIAAATAAYSLSVITIHQSIHEVGILRAIGFSQRQIKLMFSGVTLLICPLGIGLSIIIALITSPYFTSFLHDATNTIFATVSSELNLYTVLNISALFSWSSFVVIVLAVITVLFAGVLPAIRGSAVSILTALRPRTLHVNLIKLTKRKQIYSSVLIVLLYNLLYFIANQQTLLLGQITIVPLIIVLTGIVAIITVLKNLLNGIFTIELRERFHTKYCTPINHAWKSLKSNKKQVSSNVAAISVCVIIIIMSSATASGNLVQMAPRVYARIGSDIQILGLNNSSQIELLEQNPEVENICEIERVAVSHTLIDGINQLEGEGEILSYCTLGSDLGSVLRWEYLEDNGLRDAVNNLDQNNSIIISSNLAEVLGKVVGNDINLQFSETIANVTTVFFEQSYRIGAIIDTLPGIPTKNPVIVVTSLAISHLNLTESERFLIRLVDPYSYNELLAFVSTNPNLSVVSAIAELTAFEEQFSTIVRLIQLVMIITIFSVLLIVSTILLSKVILYRYVYGMYNTLGHTYNWIILMIVSEGLLVVGLGIVGGVVGSLVMYSPLIIGNLIGFDYTFLPILSIGNYYPLFEILAVFILGVIITAICGVISIKYLRSYRTIDLINNELS